MTEDPIELYMRAKAEWEMSRHKLAKLGQLLFRVGADFMGSATGPRVRATGDPFRTSRMLNEAAEQFGLDAWPSAEKLAAALEDARRAGEEAHRRYRALSEEVQATVGPPGPELR